MDLIQLLAWAAVELKNTKPDLDAVRQCLDKAITEAAKLDLNHEARKHNLVRLAKVNGAGI